MITEEEKSAVFKDELSLIFNESIREFARLCIVLAPDYFFTDCPASSTGKYHPIDELSFDGVIIHTKKCFVVSYELCKGLECEDLRDEILAACLIHDLRKQGLERSGHTVKNHPELAAQLVEQIYRDTQMISNASFEVIRNCVGYHYGPWSVGRWKKPLSDYTRAELCLYLADYIVSKRPISVAYKR